MKKFVIMFISALFLFSLAACGEKKAEEQKAPETQVEETVTADTTVADTVKTEAATEQQQIILAVSH